MGAGQLFAQGIGEQRGRDTLSREERTEQIIQTLFGELYYATEVRTVKTIGPYKPRMLEPLARFMKTYRVEVREIINSMSDDKFDKGFWLSEPFSEHATQLLSPVQIRIEKLNFRNPWWIAGLGHPDYEADFKYWSMISDLNLREAVCLTLGVSPTSFTDELLNKFAQNFDRRSGSDTISLFVGRRYELLRRKFNPLGLDDLIIPMNELKSWILEVELEVPEKFHRIILKDQAGNYLGSTPPQETRADRRELNSIAKLITTMAMEKYGYDPDRPRNPASSKIKSAAALAGLELSEDTILKYLKLGAALRTKSTDPD
jgi:hypothetical protein